MDTATALNARQVLLIGSPDFGRRLAAHLKHTVSSISIIVGGFSEAWSLALTHRPHILVFEIGYQYAERTHALARNLLQQLRERLGKDTYVIACLNDPNRLFYAGDLLFAQEDNFDCSGYIDSFVALGPGLIPSIPPIPEQVVHAMTLAGHELLRRDEGKPALPSLAENGWVQSLADPKSRELWMSWLPRYASYTNENPIIVGETGTGKTNLARALHVLSGRKGQFISITPRDFSSSELVQAELFGAVAGAYTGAVDKWGLVKSAEKGTLFIDELQSIDKDLQGKLITFIENKSYRRVGSAESVAADVRFVFASNRTLYDMMESEVLRDDFAYRLERVQLELTALSQRRLDIAPALAYALAKVRRQRPHAQYVQGVNAAAYRLLFSQRWPGNLRQLENSVAKLCELADMERSNLITEKHVVSVFAAKAKGLITTSSDILSQAATSLALTALRDGMASLDAGIEKYIELVREVALEASGGDPNMAAKLVKDDPKLLELIASTAYARRSVEDQHKN